MILFGEGIGRAKNYRIPSVVVTKRGTVIACADERFFTERDNPNRIDKVVRRSEDGGKTFGELIIVKEEQGDSALNSSAAVDACLLYDAENDVIFMLYSHTPAGIGILNCKKGTGVYESSPVITSKKVKYYAKDGRLFCLKNKEPSPFFIDKNGNVSDENREYISNVYVADGEFKEFETSYLYLTKSFDDGLSWTEPVCLNGGVKRPYMSFIGAGPGVGLKLKNGNFPGRLVFPVYYNTSKNRRLMLSCAVIYSDDGGENWTLGRSPNDSRRRFLRGSRFVLPNDCLTETQFIELQNGDLKAFIRNHSLKRLIATAISKDGGESWTDFSYHSRLVQCVCQCSVINFDYKGKKLTLFLNAASKSRRENGVLRLSFDYGETFPIKHTITEGEFVYSSMCQIDGETLGIAYEPSTKHETIEFIRLNVKELIDEKL